jgi:DNA-binding response OmpR family regulator
MKKTVLIVEDELDMRIFISTLLETSGYRPVTTKNGKEGLLKARDIGPYLIILDVMMPGEGGVQMYRQLKSDSSLMDIPVIMLSKKKKKNLRPLSENAKYPHRGLDSGADRLSGKTSGG